MNKGAILKNLCSYSSVLRFNARVHHCLKFEENIKNEAITHEKEKIPPGFLHSDFCH
jgi:hypothetical protein